MAPKDSQDSCDKISGAFIKTVVSPPLMVITPSPPCAQAAAFVSINTPKQISTPDSGLVVTVPPVEIHQQLSVGILPAKIFRAQMSSEN